MINADKLIRKFGLEKLQKEGGSYKRSYLSPESLLADDLPERYKVDKPISTAILYLISNDVDSFSALHRLPTDEIYHFYLGDPVEMLLLYPDGFSQKVILGQDVMNDQHVQFLVQKRVWQGARLLPDGNFALMGTTMAPGFTEDDYEEANREELINTYPNESDIIQLLTRSHL